MGSKDRILRVYEWFFELPVIMVLAALWLAGAMFVGLCALALYVSWVLLRTVTGA